MHEEVAGYHGSGEGSGEVSSNMLKRVQQDIVYSLFIVSVRVSSPS